MSGKKFAGIIISMITLFKGDDFDHDLILRLVEFAYKGCTLGFFPANSTGCLSFLTAEEQKVL
ncbi:MAG: hypothetical protein QW292_05535 [Candidatus Parvarchaeota archaeon]